MHTLVVFLSIGLLMAADSKEDAKKELDKLKGNWEVVSILRGGMANPYAKDDKMIIDGDKVTVKRKNGGDQTGIIKIDPSKKPKTMDLIPGDGPKKDMPHPGIYLLEGDSLKICFVQPESPRPTAFESKEGSETMLITLKREKR